MSLFEFRLPSAANTSSKENTAGDPARAQHAGSSASAAAFALRAPDDNDTAKFEAAFDDTELTAEITRLTEQLTTPHYPGRDYDARWLALLRAEAARRHLAPPADVEADASEEMEQPRPRVSHPEDALFYNIARPEDFAAVIPEVEIDRRIETKKAAAAQAGQAEEDRTRRFRIMGLRDMFILHDYMRDDVAYYLSQLPARDLLVLRKYGLGPPTATGYHDNVLKAAEAYIAAEIDPSDDPGNALYETQLADNRVITTQQKYLELEKRHAEASVTMAKMEGVTESGPVSLVGRVIGSGIATATGHDPVKGGEWGAAIGGLGDVAAPFVAELFRPDQPAEEPGPAPDPPAEVRPPPENEPAPPPDPWAGVVVDPPAHDAPPRPQLLLPETTGAPEPLARDPVVVSQEGVVERRKSAVEAATTRVNEASRRTADAQSALASAERNAVTAREAASRANAAQAEAQNAAADAKRGSPAAKAVTATRNMAEDMQRAVARADRALARARQEVSSARKNAVTQTERAKNAREALATSRRQLERVVSGQAGPRRQLEVVQPPQEVRGPSGSTITDPGYEGRRSNDPPLGRQRNRIFPQSDANYRRMLNGQPPIGIDGGPINLHHRTYVPMSQLDEYTQTEHRTLGLHEPGRDSEIDRAEFDEQRARYWVTRARVELSRR